MGEDDWLFYRSSDDEREGTIGDYTGQNLPSEEQLEQICDNMLSVQRSLSDRGIGFAVVIGPNKSSVYSEYMPDEYKKADISRTDMICEYLDGHGVNVVYSKNSIISTKQIAPVYYRYDTHWNQIGAYIACKEVLEGFDMSIPMIDPSEIVSSPLQYHYCAYDDLADMVGMKEMIFNDETEYHLSGIRIADREQIESEQRYGEPSRLSSFSDSEALYSARLLLVGDSFRTAMIDTLTTYVSEVYVISHEAYTPELIDEIQPDHVIYECVERDSVELGTFDLLGTAENKEK